MIIFIKKFSTNNRNGLLTEKGVKLLEELNKNILSGKSTVKAVIYSDDIEVKTISQAKQEIAQGNFYIEVTGQLKKEFEDLEAQANTKYLDIIDIIKFTI